MSFVVIPALIGPMLGPVAGGLIVHYLPWRTIFFVNLPIGLLGLYLVYRHLPDFRGSRAQPLDWLGLVLFSSGLALLSYVLEVFGEHTLSGREIFGLLLISLALLAAYARYAVTTPQPLLQFSLARIRTFRIAVGGGFVTRLAAGGMPFLLPLLYQVGLGYTPLQAALLIVPQPLAAMSLKMTVPAILERFGYRRVLLWNTMGMGVLIGLFSIIGPDTPVWQILLQGFLFGFSLSLQYSSTNTLVYADIRASDSSMASTISSTMQQLSMSFGVALASLVAAIFLPDRFHSNAEQMIHGLHLAFMALGALTFISVLVFSTLRSGDGAGVARDTNTIPATRLGD
jgi:MFS family permease